VKAANGLNHRDRGGASAHHTPLTDAIHAAARNEQSLQYRISDLRAVAVSNAAPTTRPVSTVPQEQVDAIDQILTPPAANPMLFTGVQPTPPKNYFIPVAAGLGLVTVFMGIIVALALYVLDNAAARSPQQSAVNVMEASAAAAAPTTTAAITKPTPSREAASAKAAPRELAPESAPQRKSAAIDERSDRRPRRLTKRLLKARRRARARRARARVRRARRAALASHQTLQQDEIDALILR
jgi:hypothetical protein